MFLYYVIIPVIATLLLCLLIKKCSYGYIESALTYLLHQALQLLKNIWEFKKIKNSFSSKLSFKNDVMFPFLLLLFGGFLFVFLPFPHLSWIRDQKSSGKVSFGKPFTPSISGASRLYISSVIHWFNFSSYFFWQHSLLYHHCANMTVYFSLTNYITEMVVYLS